MNPEKPSREEIELKLTALLLGELSAEETRLLHWAISQDEELAKLHDRLKLAIGFVREAAATPAEANPPLLAPLKLSDERREKLLAHFKTVRPVIFLPPLKKRRDISPLLAMAAAIALIAVLAAMLLSALAANKRKAQNIYAMNQAKEQALQNQNSATPESYATNEIFYEEKTKLSSDESDMAIQKTYATPPASKPAAPERSVAGLEANLQNSDATAKARNSFQSDLESVAPANQAAPSVAPPQTRIVLPQTDLGATAIDSTTGLPKSGNGQLAAASPAPSVSVVTSIRDQNRYTVHLNNASPSAVIGALQKTFPNDNNSAQVLSRPSLLVRATNQPQTLAEDNLSPLANSPAEVAANSGNSGGGNAAGGNPFAATFGVRGGGGFGGSGGGGRGGRGGRGGGSEVDGVVYAPNSRNVQTSPTTAAVSASRFGNGGGGAFGGTVINGGDGWQNRPNGNSGAGVSGDVLALTNQSETALYNGAIGSAQFSIDSDTHNLVVTSDKKTEDQIKAAINNLDGQNQTASEDRFEFSTTNAVADDGSDEKNAPMLGDSPLLGNLFENRRQSIHESASDTPDSAAAEPPAGGVVAGIAVGTGGSSPTLNPPVSAANPLGAFPGNISVNGNLALNENKDEISTPHTANSQKSYNGQTRDDTAGLRYLYTNPVVVELQDKFVQPTSGDAGSERYYHVKEGSAQSTLGSSAMATDTTPPVAAMPAPPTVAENGREGYFGRPAQMQATRALLVPATNSVNQAIPTFATTAGTQGSPRASSVTYGAAYDTVKGENGITFNFQSAPLTTVLQYMSDAYGFKIVLEATVNGNVSVISTHPMTKDEAVNLLNTVLNQNGYAAVRDGQTLTIVNKDEVKTSDVPPPKTPSPAPIPQPEILTSDNAFSTFSLNVSDVSFKLAAASLQKGVLPEAASIRSEEFINAFDYHDPEPLPGVPVAFASERVRDPFANNRDLLRFSIKTAAAGRQPGRPLNIVLLLDDSGSMERADRVAIIHEALKVLASQLQPQDTLSIVTFARTARLWVDGVSGAQAQTAVNRVSGLTPEGGTNLEEAMNLAYATARRHYLANGVNRVVLLTDGASNLGNVDPDALKQKVESFRRQGIALDCFGIGFEDYNDDLLEVLSSNGDGRYAFINSPGEAVTEFAAKLAGALQVAAEDVKVQVEFNPQRVISWRQIGYAKHQLTKEQFRDNTVAAAPMAAREAGNALYTVEINPQGEGPVATVRVRFRVPGTQDVSEHSWDVPFNGTAPALEQSSPAMRLAATAGEFSEWLASSPFAQEMTPDELLNDLRGVPEIYGADPRPKQLEMMIREAKSLGGQTIPPSQPGLSGRGGF